MTKLGLYTKFTTHAGQGHRLVEILLEAARIMEDAAGCELYIVNAATSQADTVWVTEVWDTEESHRASLSMAGVADLIKKALPLLAGSPEQIRVTPMGGKGMGR